MKPIIPLTSPDGAIHAYACGRCHKVNMGGVRVRHPVTEEELSEDIRDASEESLHNAERCCTCFDCGVDLSDDRLQEGFALRRCAPCEAKDNQRREIIDQEREERSKVYQLKLDATLKLSPDTHAANHLLRSMRDLSEEHWCAGWMCELEFELWDLIVRFQSNGDRLLFGQSCLEDSDYSELLTLRAAAGGWWMWDDNKPEGPIFVPTKEWERIFAEHEHVMKESGDIQ